MAYRGKQIKEKSALAKLLAVGLLLLAVIVFTAWHRFVGSGQLPDTNSSVVELQPPDIESINAKYLFSGTVVPARAVENEARQADGSVDYTQPFSLLDTFDSQQYNEWLVDFECPITELTIPYRQQVAETIFNCRPEFLPAMGEYFSIFNLANNHVFDLGRDKLPAMKSYIQDAGIRYVGNQDPGELEDICRVIPMRVNLSKKDGSIEQGRLPIALCAWHYFERDPLPGELEVMDQYVAIMPVFGLMHLGAEYVAQAGAQQQTVGQAIIDRGAEFVVGNSPHWVQNTEVYNDRLIFYSTGNFIFDQLDAETNRGASLDVAMKLEYDDNVAKWLKLAEVCEEQGSNCLQAAYDQNLSKVNAAFTFDIIGSVGGYRELTRRAPPAIQAAIEQRANWAETLRALGQE